MTPEEEGAVDASVAGGVAAYLRRLTDGHEFRFHRSRQYERVGLSVCACGEPVCPWPYVRLHIDRLVRAYELKVEDLLRETLRLDAEIAAAKEGGT